MSLKEQSMRLQNVAGAEKRHSKAIAREVFLSEKSAFINSLQCPIPESERPTMQECVEIARRIRATSHDENRC